jgi:hypothetical protein
VRPLFDEPWESLSLDSVRRFLADAGDEGLLWEAKGPERDDGPIRRDSIYKALSGFANSSGGYLLLGIERASKNAGPWQLPGVVFPDEPVLWTSSVITAEVGLAPIPVHDVKAFALPVAPAAADATGDAEQRHVVVVRVEPLAEPPCVTRSGAVFMRASGQTKAVTDQRVLMDLVGRGENARVAAADSALRAARRVLADSTSLPREFNVLAVGFCAVSGPDDKAGVLFDQQRSEFFFEVVGCDMQADGSVGSATSWHMRQDALYVHTGGQAPDRATTVAAFWDGAVAAAFNYTGTGHDPSLLEAIIARYWRGLAGIAAHYGSTGDAHVAVVFNLEHHSFSMSPDDMPVTDIRRWTSVREPDDVEKRSVALELHRAFGDTAWQD